MAVIDCDVILLNICKLVTLLQGNTIRTGNLAVYSEKDESVINDILTF